MLRHTSVGAVLFTGKTQIDGLFAMQKHRKIRNVPVPRPCGAAGNDEEKEETMKGLNSAVGYIRRELAHSINLRNTPEITFILDDSIEYGVNMSKKIDELNHGSENETL